MKSRMSWAYLSRVVEGPSEHLQALLAAGRDVDEIAAGVRSRASWLGGLANETESRYTWDRTELDVDMAENLGARLVCPDDSEWPQELLQQAFGFAQSGKSEHGRSYQVDAVPPHALWVKGQPLTALLTRTVAVVGTRAASNYGKAATRQIVSDVVKHQWVVVSGGALGIDTIAHETALQGAAPTVAIAACGLDRTYPAANKNLFNSIASRGAIISEYPPGVPPQRHRFLTRNRLVAALTQGTVVVEAAWRSGALNTLSWAEGLGRVPMAVPGPVTGPGSLGCHARIRDGRAQLVTSGADVRSLVEAIGAVSADAQYELDFAPGEVQKLSRNELRVFDALPMRGPRETDAIARETGMTIALTVTLLLELSRRSLVRREGTSWARCLNS